MAPPTEEILRILSANIGLGWKKIGTFLGFKWSKLRQFEANNPNYAEDAIFEMFNTWRAKQRSDPEVNSTEELRTALKKADQHLICDKLFPSNESRSTSLIVDLKRQLRDVQESLSGMVSIENLDTQLKEKQKEIDQLRREKNKQKRSLQKTFTKTLDEYANATAEYYQKIIDENKAELNKQEHKLAEASNQGEQIKEQKKKMETIQHNFRTVKRDLLKARKDNGDLMKENKGSQEKLALLQQQLDNYQMEKDKATEKLSVFTQKYEYQENEKSKLRQKVKKTKLKMDTLLKEKQDVTEELDQARKDASLKEEGYQLSMNKYKTVLQNSIESSDQLLQGVEEKACLQKQVFDMQEKIDLLQKDKDEIMNNLLVNVKQNTVSATAIVQLKEEHTKLFMMLEGYRQAMKKTKSNLLRDRFSLLGKHLILGLQRQRNKTDFKIKKMVIT